MAFVLTVGHCDFDHGNLSRLLEASFGAVMQRAHGLDDALDALRTAPCDLVLINRLLDRDGSEGLAVLKRLKSDPAGREVPVMLISNYADAQAAAVEAGALAGFGKADLDNPETLQRLRAALIPEDRGAPGPAARS